jgi:hypothetical protein
VFDGGTVSVIGSPTVSVRIRQYLL